jgi:hypothetical protein
LGTFKSIRLAFVSARFLSSALIFSIKVLVSGVKALRVEFMAPSAKRPAETNQISEQGNRKSARASFQQRWRLPQSPRLGKTGSKRRRVKAAQNDPKKDMPT